MGMDQRSSFLIQVLEKLASPLVASISEVTVRQSLENAQNPIPADQSLKNEAQQLASLLTSTTQLSIALSSLMDMQSMSSDHADAVRVGLAGISSPLIANIYRQVGRYPNESDINRLTAAMGTVVTYANNFEAAAEAQVRLSNFDNDFAPLDADQQLLKYMFVLLPMLNSVLTYSFGQPDKKVIQEVTERLIRTVKASREKLFPNMEDVMVAKGELALLRVATLVYSQCHFAEVAKIMSNSEAGRQGPPPTMDALWAAFDERMAMIDVLAETLMPARGNAATGATSGARKPVTAAPLYQGSPKTGGSPTDRSQGDLPLQPIRPAAPVAPVTPAPTEPPSGDDSPNPDNPMSFFAKKSG